MFLHAFSVTHDHPSMAIDATSNRRLPAVFEPPRAGRRRGRRTLRPSETTRAADDPSSVPAAPGRAAGLRLGRDRRRLDPFDRDGDPAVRCRPRPSGTDRGARPTCHRPRAGRSPATGGAVAASHPKCRLSSPAIATTISPAMASIGHSTAWPTCSSRWSAPGGRWRWRPASRAPASSAPSTARGLARLFVASRCADEGRPKPHPWMLESLAEETGVATSAMIMIGDTSHDIGMARSAGSAAVGVAYGAHDRTAIDQAGPDWVVESIAELRLLLERGPAALAAPRPGAEGDPGGGGFAPEDLDEGRVVSGDDEPSAAAGAAAPAPLLIGGLVAPLPPPGPGRAGRGSAVRPADRARGAVRPTRIRDPFRGACLRLCQSLRPCPRRTRLGSGSGIRRRGTASDLFGPRRGVRSSVGPLPGRPLSRSRPPAGPCRRRA